MEKIARSNGMFAGLDLRVIPVAVCVCQTWVGGSLGNCVDPRGLAIQSPEVPITAPSLSGQALFSSPVGALPPVLLPEGTCPE